MIARHAAWPLLRTLAFVALFAAAPLGAQPVTPDFGAVRDTIRAIMAAGNVPSISVAIARGDRVLWEESFGSADIERKIPATPHTLYSLASISKPITATGLMVLVERGRIDLDQPANRYLGAGKLRAFEGPVADATVRRLLTHTAGLPLHYQFFYAGGVPVHSMDTAIARYGIVVYRPGERYFYSNLGYGILDHIIARTSGSSYPEFMQREVFGPLGLSEITVSDGSALGERGAVRYDNDRTPLPPYTFDHLGASSVYASAHDLVRFGQWHLGVRLPGARDVLTAETRRRMQRSDAPADQPGSARGWGWGIAEDDNGLRRVAHGGGMPGVATLLWLYPAESLSVVVLANAGGVPTARIAAAMTSAVVPSYAEIRRARADSARQARAARGGNEPAADVAASAREVAGRWSGTILVRAERIPFTITVDAEGRGVARLGDQAETPLENLHFEGGWLSGRFTGEVLGADAAGPAARGRHMIVLHLKVGNRDSGIGNRESTEGSGAQRLHGWASVIANADRSYGAVSYRVELAR
jgi:CubicO group peptidase (beta-lactamase class C family)